MHKNATKYNKTQSEWCINKHRTSKIIDTFETYHGLQYVFWKVDRALRVFSSRRIYRKKGNVRRWTRGPHHAPTWPRGGPRHGGCGRPLAPPPSLLWTLFHVRKNRNFSICFIQFREYFLCNFSETQKQQKIGNWHCGISLIG
jgi:hypothetical protein